MNAGVYLEDVDCIKDIKKDIVQTIEKCHLVTQKESVPNPLKGIWQAFLRILAPLM